MFVLLLMALSYPATIGFISFLAIYLFYRNKNKTYNNLIDRIPGPKPRYPLIGNIDMFRIKDVPLNQGIYRILLALCKVYEKYGIFKIQLGHKNWVVLFRHDTSDSIFTSKDNITKSDEYTYLWDWLGRGLLTSTGGLWKSRRRMLTPAFHFKILEDFLPVMNEQSNVLVNKLRNRINEDFIDIRDYITQCTLDIICETAMGVSIGAQVGNNREYVNAIHNLGEIFMKRIFSPWVWSDFIFYSTGMGKEFKKELNILHSMTRKVIKERKSDIILKKKVLEESDQKSMNQINDSNIYLSNKSRKRLAFLDLLLEYHIDSNALSLEDIREEVDTFMFEGHDTTSVSMSWTLYLLGLHPDVQIRIQEELELIFGDQTDRDITNEDLQKMNYLECVLRESLRIYPSVPFIGRTLSEDLKSGDYMIPKGSIVYMIIERLHFDPNIFPDPLHFKPERFENESTSNINAYTYVPFSAGPRSCIGKRFALNEEKIILSKILLNFNLRSLDPRDKMISSAEMVFRPKCPLRVQIIPKEQFNR